MTEQQIRLLWDEEIDALIVESVFSILDNVEAFQKRLPDASISDIVYTFKKHLEENGIDSGFPHELHAKVSDDGDVTEEVVEELQTWDIEDRTEEENAAIEQDEALEEEENLEVDQVEEDGSIPSGGDLEFVAPVEELPELPEIVEDDNEFALDLPEDIEDAPVEISEEEKVRIANEEEAARLKEQEDEEEEKRRLEEEAAYRAYEESLQGNKTRLPSTREILAHVRNIDKD